MATHEMSALSRFLWPAPYVFRSVSIKYSKHSQESSAVHMKNVCIQLLDKVAHWKPKLSTTLKDHTIASLSR
jgi:hypothetical protein